MIIRRMQSGSRTDIVDETHAVTVSHLRGKGVIVLMTSQVVSLKISMCYPIHSSDL